MGGILKFVYENWFVQEGIRYPLPNGLHKKIVDQLLELLNGTTMTLSEAQKVVSARVSGDVFVFNHCNLNGYFLKDKGVQNFCSLDEVVYGNEYFYPIEIRTSPNTTYQKLCVQIDGRQHSYKLIDTLSEKTKKLLQYGTVKIVFNQAQDPLNNTIDLDIMQSDFNRYNVPSKNLIFIAGNKYSEYKKHSPKCGIKLTDATLMISQQVATNATYYPKHTSLGYISDLVREDDLDSNNIRENRFICFNRMMRPHRIAMAYVAIKLNLLDNNIFTFLNLDANNDVEHFKNCIKQHFPNETNPDHYAKSLFEIIPYELETQHLKYKGSFAIDNTNKKHFLNSYVNIITETKFDANVDTFISEKTWRPISNLQPFILLNSAYSLQYLKDLGFKTFHPFINETYDNFTSIEIRYERIFNEIKKLNDMPIQELHDWYYSITDILVHNQKHLYTLKDISPFKDTWNDLKRFYYD